MFSAFIYKEWIKTRKIVYLLVATFAAFIAYTFISIAQLFRAVGAVQAWEGIIIKDMPVIPSAEWLPLLAGLILAIGQFAPEMTNKRLKLTLHLPLPENKTITYILAYGLIVLLSLFALSYIALVAGLQSYFASEIVCSTAVSTLPWFLAGLTGYLLTAWVCLEPVWRQRIFNALIAICALSFFFIATKTGGYVTFVPYLAGLLIVSFVFPFYSTARFKDGAQ